MAPPTNNRRLHGRAISPGLTAGQAFVVRELLESGADFHGIERAEVARELAKLQRASETVIQDLELTAARVEQQTDARLAAIFRAHQTMLRDPALVKELTTEVEQELVDIEQAVRRVFRRWERRLQEAGLHAPQRADDLRDLGRRLLRALGGTVSHPLQALPPARILVAAQLLPSDTVHLSRRAAAGIVVESGSAGSHAAVLARELGIPMVAQLATALDEVDSGDMLLVDGYSGSVIVRPDMANRLQFARRRAHHRADLIKAKQVCRDPAVTCDGAAVQVLANVGDRDDVELAVDNGADGVGLFRVDQFYLSRTRLPEPAELLDALRQAIAPLRHGPITIRLLDVGGDKQLPYLRLPPEENPFLGLRGVRLLLRYPELMRTQLQACLALAREREIKLLVPMITLASEMRRMRLLLRAAAKEAGVPPPALGAMIETPAAALSVAAIARHADFLSVGTNDLTQYTLAAGRENPQVADYFNESHPVLMRLLKIVVAEAGALPLEVCGELAGYPDAVPRLLRIGIRTLSVAPPLIPFVKQAIRQASAHRAQRKAAGTPKGHPSSGISKGHPSSGISKGHPSSGISKGHQLSQSR